MPSEDQLPRRFRGRLVLFENAAASVVMAFMSTGGRQLHWRSVTLSGGGVNRHGQQFSNIAA